MLTLPFAEDLHLHDSSDEVLLALLDDHKFPPLDSTTSPAYFAQQEAATVWTCTRSYAETAAQSGVKHEPIQVLDILAPCMTQLSTKDTTSHDLQEQPYYDEDDDLVYEQAKSIAMRRLGVDHTAHARKLKTVETTYRLNLQESIQNLPPSQEAQLQRAQTILKGARSLAAGYFKRLPCFTPPDFRFELPRDWKHNCSMQEFPHVLREYIMKEHMYDINVEAALGELQSRIYMGYWTNTGWVRAQDFVTYHITMEHVLKNRFIPEYELVVKKLEIDQAKTEKQRLWLIRRAIPSTKYMHSRTSRVQYAKQILQQ